MPTACSQNFDINPVFSSNGSAYRPLSKLRKADILSVSEYHPLDSPTTYATYAVTSFALGSVRNEYVNVLVC